RALRRDVLGVIASTRRLKQRQQLGHAACAMFAVFGGPYHGEALPALLADSLRTREVLGFILDRLKDFVAHIIERTGTRERVLVGEVGVGGEPGLDRATGGKLLILADAPQRISFGNTVTDTLGDLGVAFARAPHPFRDNIMVGHGCHGKSEKGKGSRHRSHRSLAQRSSLRGYWGVLSFRSEAREVLIAVHTVQGSAADQAISLLRRRAQTQQSMWRK